MSKLPEGITAEDLARYVKIKKQLDKVLPVFTELEHRIKSGYRDAHEGLSKKTTYVVDEAPLVVTLTPNTGLNAKRFAEEVPYDVEEYKHFYKVVPDTSEIQKDEDMKRDYYETATTAVSIAITG